MRLALKNLKIEEIDYIAINRDPNSCIFEKLIAIRKTFIKILSIGEKQKKRHDIVNLIHENFNIEKQLLKVKFIMLSIT